jgi:hypothetical protein
MVVVVLAACVVTFAAVTVGTQLALGQIHHGVDRGWLPLGLTFVVAFWILASWLPPARFSRALRVAVLLPGAHAIVVALAWPAWTALSRFVDDPNAASALVTDFPIARVVVASLAAFAAFAMLVARKRSGEWLHGFIMLALSELLLLGLWLPVSCSLWPGGESDWWTSYEPIIAEVAPRVAWTVVPPTLAALAFTALALRRPRQLLQQRKLIGLGVAVAIVVAVASRLDPPARVMVLYSNVLPLLLAATVVAVCALILYGAALAVRSARLRRAFAAHKRSEGVIVRDGDDTPVLGFEITSWLRGPRTVQRGFAVSTPAGTIPISGAHLVASLPAETTQLRVGECIAVLRPGDRVAIAGHADAAGDPFRTSAAPLAGESYVAALDHQATGFAHVALAMWRPCIAYLLIVVAVALPALAALAAT